MAGQALTLAATCCAWLINTGKGLLHICSRSFLPLMSKRERRSTEKVLAAQEQALAASLCVCEREWTGEGMLCCDACERWYHPECVGVSSDDFAAQTSDPEARWCCGDCQGAAGETTAAAAQPAAVGAQAAAPATKQSLSRRPPSDDPLFCVCEQPWRGEEMLTCDQCEGWFHPLCQDMEDLEYLQLFAPESLGLPPSAPPKWVCCGCSAARPATTLPQPDAEAQPVPAAVVQSDCTADAEAAAAAAQVEEAAAEAAAATERREAAAAAAERREIQPQASASAALGDPSTTTEPDRPVTQAAARGPVGRGRCGVPVGRRRKARPTAAGAAAGGSTASAAPPPQRQGATTLGVSAKSIAIGRSRRPISTAGAGTGAAAAVGTMHRPAVHSASARRGGLPGMREGGGAAAMGAVPVWWAEDLQRARGARAKTRRPGGETSSPDEAAALTADGKTCSVCLCRLGAAGDVARTPCSHEFCRPCLLSALSRCGERCPLCRRNLARFLLMLRKNGVQKVDLFA